MKLSRRKVKKRGMKRGPRTDEEHGEALQVVELLERIPRVPLEHEGLNQRRTLEKRKKTSGSQGGPGQSRRAHRMVISDRDFSAVG